MIYLLPNWTEQTNIGDDSVSKVQSILALGSLENKLLIPNFFPFLRYKLNSQGINYNNIIRIYDILQDIEVDSGHPLDIDSIPLPSKIDKIYTPNKVLLVKNSKKIGYLEYNQYGFISTKTIYMGTGYSISTYDDRGFLSNIQYYENINKLLKTEFFNERGEETLEVTSDGLIVKSKNHPFLKHREYSSIDQAIEEVLKNIIFIDNKTKTTVIGTTDGGISKIIDPISLNINLVLLVNEKGVLNNNSTYILESPLAYNHINSNKNIKYIPIHYPELNLGNSNNEELMDIFIHFDKINENIEKVMINIIDLMTKNESIKLTCASDEEMNISLLERQHKSVIGQYFDVDIDSEEYKKVETYIIKKSAKKLFTIDSERIKEVQKSKKWKNYVDAVNTSQRIIYIKNQGVEQLQERLQTARIYVDLNSKYHISYHSIAVGTGIPIITSNHSDFIINEKNGFVSVNNEQELIDNILYFIDSISNWNKSLVYSIKVIEKYNKEDIFDMWKGVITNHG